MGFISNQWLNRGQRLKNRSYSPVAVSITSGTPKDQWSQEREIRIEFTAKREIGEYQTLHLSALEAEGAVRPILACCSEEVRAEILRELLGRLSDPELLRTLAADVRKRVQI